MFFVSQKIGEKFVFFSLIFNLRPNEIQALAFMIDVYFLNLYMIHSILQNLGVSSESD